VSPSHPHGVNRRLLLAAVASACALAACKDAPSTGPASAPGTPAAKSTPVSVEAIAAEAQGFNMGSAMSTRTVYVFFDAQCPHCSALWAAAKPLKGQARFVWIPVGVLNATSTAQGAALLSAADPVAAMDQHEASMREKGGGIGGGGPEEKKNAVKKNTELMTRFGFGSVPTVVGKHAQSGELVTIEGSVPTATLASKLGLTVPAS
jgi:thiol:disulfide interchange protein DsbG